MAVTIWINDSIINWIKLASSEQKQEADSAGTEELSEFPRDDMPNKKPWAAKEKERW